LTASQTLVKQSGPFCVECVICYRQIEHLALALSSEESAYNSVEISADLVFGENDLFPPHAAHEEKRENNE
jgi:hypothetical protein